MSHHPSEAPASALPRNFDTIFIRVLDTYKKRTKRDLRSHPLYSRLEACASPDAILTILREASQSQNVDVRFTNWLAPTVNVLYASCDMLGEAAGLVCIKRPPLLTLIYLFNRHSRRQKLSLQVLAFFFWSLFLIPSSMSIF